MASLENYPALPLTREYLERILSGGSTDVVQVATQAATQVVSALPAVAKTGDYSDLANKPPMVTSYDGKTGAVTSAKRDIYINGTKLGDEHVVLISQGTINNGVATFSATKTDGSPILQSILPDSASISAPSTGGIYSFGVPTLSADRKTITATARMASVTTSVTSLLVATSNLLFGNPANGTAARLLVYGLPATA